MAVRHRPAQRLLHPPLSVVTAILAAWVATVVGAGPVAACTCGALDFTLPSENTELVPSNTRVWVGRAEENPAATGTWLLVDADSLEEISTTASVISMPGGTVAVLTPSAELTPGLTYSVREANSSGELTHFTVAADRDATSPAAPTVAVLRAEAQPEGGGDSCPKSDYLAVYQVVHEGALSFAVRETATLDITTWSGEAVTVALDAGAVIGDGNCVNNWPGATEGSVIEVYYVTADLAGNTSVYTALISAQIPDGCGCSVAADRRRAPFGVLLVLGLVGLGLRRWRGGVGRE